MHIQELTLKTASIHRTKLFYHKTLELPIVKESEDSISFQIGKSVLIFEQIENEKPYYHIAFNITNNRFSDSFEWINRKLDVLYMENGLPIASYPNWNAESFYFYDNNGSILEFIVRFDLPYYSSEPFSINDIAEISEVGVVTADVSSFTEKMNSAFRIPYFKNGPALADFSVMGDDHGLLIVSQTGRHWVPTHKSAQRFPMAIKADDVNIEL